MEGFVVSAGLQFHVRFECWALSIVKEANRQGLMQSAELAVDSQGRLDGALCNCCNDCCFPRGQDSRSGEILAPEPLPGAIVAGTMQWLRTLCTPLPL